MSPRDAGVLGSVARLFVEPTARAVVTQSPLTWPSVAVLGDAGAAAVAAGISSALADRCSAHCALVAAIGSPPAAVALSPAAARAAARLRRHGQPARARGRLVWLANDAAAADRDADPAGAAAALGAHAARAAATIGAPSVLALPLARSAALDRVLSWHDGVVVVQPSGASAAIAELVLDSLAALGRPVAAVPAPGRIAARAAVAGLHTPAFATEAVARLGVGEELR